MTELDRLFRQRIGISENEKVAFETLGQILEKAAQTIPFENLRVIEGYKSEINKEYLIDKILIKKEGGLCYEINPLLYFFLLDNQFNAGLVRGVVYNHTIQDWSATGSTHTAVIIYHELQYYLVDIGFGGNSPIKPVPLNGRMVTSLNGEFRIRKIGHTYGDHILDIKIKHKDKDWKLGYIFDSNNIMTEISYLNEIKKIINVHPSSSFNKGALLTRFTSTGSITLTDHSIVMTINGITTKEDINSACFKELKKQYFFNFPHLFNKGF